MRFPQGYIIFNKKKKQSNFLQATDHAQVALSAIRL